VISVVLPFHDAEATLREAAESVLADLGRHDELVMIDDRSRDGGPAIARALAARDARVVLTATAGEGGIVEALTVGVDQAKGELIGRMDADDVSLPGRFAAERALLRDRPELGAVAVQVELFPSFDGGMGRYIAWQNGLLSPEDHARSVLVEAPLCHPATLLRRSALRAVGGYREVPWAEDFDLWLRLDAAGFALAKVPEVLFRWRVRPDSLTWTGTKSSHERMRLARAAFLDERLRGRAYAVGGAGTTGRRLARALEGHGMRASFFIDIDPRKIGRTARQVPIVSADEGLSRARRDEACVVVAVGAEGARDLVRAELAARGLVEGRAFVCAA
jgi:glycosyltransferase involved in cell wall biosynthesis